MGVNPHSVLSLRLFSIYSFSDGSFQRNYAAHKPAKMYTTFPAQNAHILENKNKALAHYISASCKISLRLSAPQMLFMMPHGSDCVA
jgi:hypothetical protein